MTEMETTTRARLAEVLPANGRMTVAIAVGRPAAARLTRGRESESQTLTEGRTGSLRTGAMASNKAAANGATSRTKARNEINPLTTVRTWMNRILCRQTVPERR